MTAAPQSCAALGRCSLLPPCYATSLSLLGGFELDLKYLIYRRIIAMIGWFFGLELRFLPDSREVREVREAGRAEACPSRLRRERHGLRESGGLHLAQVAGDVVAGEDLAHLRLLLRAALEGVGAAGVEAAARGRVDRARHVALQDDALARRLGVGNRDRRQERLGVGVLRAGEEGALVGELDDLAEIHDRDAVADVLDHRKVVGDEG